MTILEKRKRIKQLIDALNEEHLSEAILMLEDLSKKDEMRKTIVKELLYNEKSLFERLSK